MTIWASEAFAKDYCASDPRIEAVDLSAPVSQGFLNNMQAIGIKTIIRYYDHEDETLPGKTLRRAERDLILSNGFKTAVVFQHHNDQFASFTQLRGSQDAERSIALATENSQPKGGTIYFGVDGPWKAFYELTNIAAYFKEVYTRLVGTGYRVGCWQTASPRHAGSQLRPLGPNTTPITSREDGDWRSFAPRSAVAETSILTWSTVLRQTTDNSGFRER